MKTTNCPILVRSAVATAVLAAFTQAMAADDMIQLTKPSSEISLGVGYVSADNDRFGQYTGLRDQGLVGQVDFNVNLRDDEGGTWTILRGENVGRPDVGLRLDQSKQGDWRYFFRFDRIPHYDPLNIATRVTGIGTANIDVPATGALQPTELKTVREKMSFGFTKYLGENFDLDLRMSSEDKDGARFFGAYGHVFAPEPIQSTTTQWQATLNYSADQLQLSGGYYGSRYSNAFSTLDVTGVSTQTPIALSPDNQSHQIFLSGGYSFTPTTRGNFKVSYARAEQDQAFDAAFTPRHSASADRQSLDGKVDTTLVNLGLTSRPIDRLSLLANVRYEDRDDKTPRTQFVAASASRSGFNEPMSRKSTLSKAEATYRLPADYRVTAGVDLEQREREAPPLRQASWRSETDELTQRLELRKSLSSMLNGRIGYEHSKRDGSAFLPAGSAADADVIAPVHWADRTRDKVKLALDWTPIQRLSLQFLAERSVDDYKQLSDIGPDEGTAKLYSLDANFAISDNWQITGWLTRDETVADGGSCAVTSAQPVGTPANTPTNGAGSVPSATVFCEQVTLAPTNSAWRKWHSSLQLQGDSGGFGIKGKLTSKLIVSADVEASYNRSKYSLRNGTAQDNDTTTVGGAGTVASVEPPSASDLPSHAFRLFGLRATADYAYRPDVSFGAVVQHQRTTTDDWQWTDGVGGPYRYGAAADPNTTVAQPGKEIVNFVGVSLAYKWW